MDKINQPRANPSGQSLDLAEATKPRMVELIAPDNVSAISVRGMSFEIPENGTVSAPTDIAEELKSHGFTEPKVEVETPKVRSRVRSDT